VRAAIVTEKLERVRNGPVDSVYVQCEADEVRFVRAADIAALAIAGGSELHDRQERGRQLFSRDGR
jgi:hypothetical protein